MKADLASLRSLPRTQGEPVFDAPWQARVFALTLQLYENGCFSWSEWADQLSAEIAADNAADYYLNWLNALEKMIQSKELLR